MAQADWTTLLYLGDQVALSTEHGCNYILGLTNDPDLGPIAPEIVVPGMVRDGGAMTKSQYVQPGKIAPGMTGAQTPLTASAMEWLMANMMSNVAIETGLPLHLAHAAYTSDQPTVWYTLKKYMTANATSRALVGSVITHIAGACPADGMGQLTFDALAMTAPVPAQAITGSTIISGTGLLTKDAEVSWDGDVYQHIAFDFDIKNNAFHRYEQAQTPTAILLGQLEMSGNLTVEWEDAVTNGAAADVAAGYDAANEFPVVMTWGVDGTAPYIYLACAAYVSGKGTQGIQDGYQVLTFPWKAVAGTVVFTSVYTASVPYVNTP